MFSHVFFLFALILFLREPCHQLSQEDVERPDTFSPWCRVKNKLQRGEFRSGHWQKIPVVPAVRKIRCHHLYWDNTSYSHWMHSIYQSNITGNFRLLILEYWHAFLIFWVYLHNCATQLWAKANWKKKNKIENYISFWNFCKQDHPEDQKICCCLTSTCVTWRSF